MKKEISFASFIKHPLAREFTFVFKFLTNNKINLDFCDWDGKSTVFFTSRILNKYCGIINEILGPKYCKASVAEAGKKSFQKMEPIIYSCPFSLIDITAALSTQKHWFGNLSTGQFLLGKAELKKVKEIFEQFFQNKPVEFRTLKEAYGQVPQISPEELFVILRLLKIFQKYINTFGEDIFFHHKADRHLYSLKKQEGVEYYLYLLTYSLVTNTKFLSPFQEGQILKFLGINHFPNTAMIIQRQRKKCQHQTFNFEKYQKAENKLINSIKACFPFSLKPLVVPWKERQTLCLFYLPFSSSPEHSRETLKIGNKILEKLNQEINIGIGKTYFAVEELPASYQEAMTALKYASFRRGKQIVHIDHFYHFKKFHLYSDLDEVNLTLLDALVKKKLHLSKREMTLAMKELKKLSLEQAKNWVLKILSDIYQKVIKIRGVERSFFLKRHLEILERIFHFRDLNELRKFFKNSLLEYQEMSNQLSQERKENLLQLVKEYINANYQKNIRRKDVAAALNISESTLVKALRESKTSFVKCLTEKRLEVARELLQKSNLSVNEVAFKVGYQNIYAFYHAFRSFHKITPGEYRKSFSPF